MQVIEIPHGKAAQFIERWHYSHRVPTGANMFFGWFNGDDMYAVADYGTGVNPYAAGYLSKTTGEQVTVTNLVELKRLCRIEPKHPNRQLTQFLSLCHKNLKWRGFCFVVSFSDPAEGHDGGIYKAASFRNIGQTNPEWHTIDKAGEIRHRRYSFRYARRNNCSVADARKRLGLTRVETVPKDRWFKKINSVASARRITNKTGGAMAIQENLFGTLPVEAA